MKKSGLVLFFLLTVLVLQAQPPNNDFALATDISSLINSCSANAAYTTMNATPDQAAGLCWGNGPNNNVWFRFTATASQYMKVQVKVGGAEGSMQYAMVALWNSSLSQLACQNYQNSASDIETDYYGLTAGQTYYISVDNYAGASYRGTFTLCLSDVVDYNFYEGALDVSGLINNCSANAAYTTMNATPDQAAGSCWVNGPSYNRWFKFTATASQYMKVQVKVGGVEGNMQNAMVALWNSSLGQLACQNYQSSSADIETDYYGLTAGQTYYISVDNYAGASYRGTFTLCLSDVVDYNFYEGALDVSGLINNCSANAAYTTMNATPDQAAGSCWVNGPNNNRWFKFTATASQYMKVQVKVGGAEGSMQNAMVALWNSSLSQLACQNYQSSNADIETDYYGLTAGQTYYISVDNYAGASYRGTFTLCLSDVVDYNFYEGALDVSGLINNCSANAAYTTMNATPDQAAGSCWVNGPNNNRWFKFTATASQYMKVQVKVGGAEGNMQNAMVALWNSSLSQLACQNYQSSNADIETDYYGLTAGQTYYISVDNYAGASYRGTFTLCLSDVVDYNFYEGALDVSGLINNCSANAAYTTMNATADQAAGSCWVNGPNNNRWFKFTATASQYMKVQVKVGGAEGSMQNAMVALWNSSLSPLACQNYQSSASDIETDYYGLTAGQTYFISVDNYAGASYRGTFTLCLSDVVDYNFYEGALDVSGLINGCSANAAYTTMNATPDQAAGSCWGNGPSNNRWFKFTATASQYMKVQVKVGGAEGSMQYAMVALWNSSLSQLACQNYQSSASDIETDYYGLTAGQTYYISVDNYTGSAYRGTFTLCLSDVLDNNFYEGATLITDLNNWCSANAQYSTVNATPDKNKGSCWSNGPNYNRWFMFTAVTTTVTVQVKVGGVEGSMQYPFVALWESNGTTQRACTNYAGSAVDISLTYNTLTIGNTYYISVDNYIGPGFRGSFTLCVNSVDPTVYYSRANGLWSDPNTWSNAGYGGIPSLTTPGAGNVVNIRDNTILVNSAAQCAEVNISTNVGNALLTIDNSTLQVNGKFTQTNSTNNANTITVQNGGNLNIANNLLPTRTGGTGGNQINIPSGTVTIGQDLIWTSSGGTVANNVMTVSGSSTLTVGRDLLMNHSGGMKVSMLFNNSATATIGRDLTFTSITAGQTEVIFNNTASLHIRRNIVRGATPYGVLTFNPATTLYLEGVANQQVVAASSGAGGDGITYRNVVFNNTSGFATDFIMGGIASINGAATFTQGVLQSTTSNYPEILSTGSTTIGSVNSFVDGPIAITTSSSIPATLLSFPVGNSGAYRPAQLSITHTDNSPVTYTAQHFSSSAAALGYTLAPTIERVSGVRYWSIDRSSVANLTSASVTLHYGIGSNDGVTDPPNLRVVKTNGAGTVWVDAGGTGTASGMGSITSDPFTTFSIITLGNAHGGTNPLPIELKSFQALSVAEGVLLKWVTSSELNNHYFSLERSGNGIDFSELVRMDGAGTTNIETHYSYLDNNPLTGRAYYRLKQVDFDNAYSYSKIVAVESRTEQSFSYKLYPNPVKEESFTVELNGYNPGNFVHISIADQRGKKLITSSAYTDNSGSLELEFSRENLAPGVYLVTILVGTSKVFGKLVIL